MSNLPNSVRFLPPNGKAATISANGRSYSAAANSFVDVPNGDAWLPAANGWIKVAGSGTTAQRPANPFPHQLYHDTTLNMVIVFEGTAWRRPDTGAAV